MLSTITAINKAASDLPLQKLFDYAAGKVIFSWVCALYSKIHGKVLTVYMGLDWAVFTQSAKQGSGLEDHEAGP